MERNVSSVVPYWPELPLASWRDTCDRLHMWTRIVGKIRLALSPHFNHWWQVPLYVTTRGLTTHTIPYGSEIFEIRFDFVAHNLVFESSDGRGTEIVFKPMSVAEFYLRILARLSSPGIEREPGAAA